MHGKCGSEPDMHVPVMVPLMIDTDRNTGGPAPLPLVYFLVFKGASGELMVDKTKTTLDWNAAWYSPSNLEGIYRQWLFFKENHEKHGLNICANLPSIFVRSIFRHNYPNNDVDRSEIVFKNFFLHFHPVKCHKHSLDPFYTLGLGSDHHEPVFHSHIHRGDFDVLLHPC